MELFIPSLLVLVLGALICFFVIPRISPYTLGVLAIVMFGLGVWQHYQMFPYEYSSSMVTDILRDYAGFIMILALIFAGIVGTLMIHGRNPPTTTDVIPEVALPNLGVSAAVTNAVNAGKNLFNLNSGNANNTKVANATKPANALTNNSKRNNLASPSFKVV